MAVASTYSTEDEYGFKRDSGFNAELYNNYITILTRRSIKWQKYIERNDANVMSRKLKRYIRKGIPLSLREQVWMKTSGARMKQLKKPNLYQQLYNSKNEFDRVTVESIEIDLPRTFPNNIYFGQYQRSLANVLNSYAHYNKDVGYCQGLNYIAGLMLIVTKNEESTFWLLKELIDNTIPFYHIKTMAGLIRDIDVLSELVKKKLPDVHNHINNLGLPWAVIATKWFICIFAEVLPVETVLRVWDCIFSEGYKIIFRVCLTIIMLLKTEILECDDISNLANLFRSLERHPRILDCHGFMVNVFKLPGNFKHSEIEQIRTLVTQQKQLEKKKNI